VSRYATGSSRAVSSRAECCVSRLQLCLVRRTGGSCGSRREAVERRRFTTEHTQTCPGGKWRRPCRASTARRHTISAVDLRGELAVHITDTCYRADINQVETSCRPACRTMWAGCHISIGLSIHSHSINTVFRNVTTRLMNCPLYTLYRYVDDNNVLWNAVVYRVQ